MTAASVAPGAADRHGPAPRTDYRPDIDGLRAVAVVAVVLFHAEVPGFGGGYVGVDVFFVISGYLITNLLLAEPSLIRFYERRIRRVFPALFATIALCLAAACLLLLPQDLERFGHSLLATTWFVSNLLFWSEAGYFDAAAELKPLLHTWSLAVEEQFYIAFPLYLLALTRLPPDLRAPLTFGLCALSLVVSEWLVRAATGAFFLTPARGFELLIGACLAIGRFAPPPGRLAAEAMAAGGGLLIAASVLLYAPETVFPGWHALVPCLGAALLIHAGTSGRPQLNRALGAGPVVFVGLISYSLYLWHWPILAFARYWLIRPLQPAETALLIALSVLVATLSWRFVEMPFRGRAPLMTRRSLFGAAGAVMGAAGALAGVLIVGDGLPARWPPDLVALAAAARDRPPARCNDRDAAEVERRELCRLGLPGDVAPSFIVWGDSHGEALVPPIDRAAALARRSGWLVTKAGCPALLGVGQRRPGFNRSCIDFGRAVEDLLAATPSIDTVLLISRWAIYATGERYGEERGARVLIGTPDSHRYALAENPRVFEAGLMRTLGRLRELGMRAVIVAQVPEVGWDVPGVLARARRFGTRLAIEPTLDDYLARQRLVHRVLEKARARYGIEILYPHEVLCPKTACAVLRDGRPMYADADHLSRFGSGFLTGLFRPAWHPRAPRSRRRPGRADRA